ncbi:MAG: uncharacterized protein KVP18_001209 [Porospora cf. gigantea A]|uniref:uncharacterized protein n=2 Tax=Porospora cf. gigantea A TaxID=2853593 RepID=UPI0035598D3C|nr:MAG: hypothetical protein KVP18_001209 [Porospora cf. gigantea A]
MDDSPTFSSRIVFWLTIVGCSVGFGNIWRFPYVVSSRGGLSFILMYALILCIVAVPTLLIEFGLGQASRANMAGTWCSMGNKRLRFMSLGSLAPFLLSLFYPLLLVWSLTYFFACFQRDLPWQPKPGQDWLEAANSFFESSLRISSQRDGGITAFNWPLFGYLCLTYGLIFMGVMIGPRLMGKLMYVTMTLPAVFLLVLLGIGASRPGAITGIKAYIANFDPSTFQDQTAWVAATTQAVFSLSLGSAVLYTLGSHNPIHQNFITDACVMIAADTAFALVAGFAVYSVLGFLSQQTSTPLNDLPIQGIGLAFKSYPVGLATLPYPWANIVTAMFFLVLILLGWDTLVCEFESSVNLLTNSRLNKRNLNLGWKTTTAVVCLSLFIANLLLVTDVGIYWLEIVDHYLSFFVLVLFTWLENVLVAWALNAQVTTAVIGPMRYMVAFSVAVGLPATVGLGISIGFTDRFNMGAQWYLLGFGIFYILGLILVPLSATTDLRNGNRLSIPERYYHTYAGNIGFLRDNFNSITNRKFSLFWFLTMKIPTSSFLTFISFLAFGRGATWWPGLQETYSVWMQVLGVVLVAGLCVAIVVFILLPENALLLAAEDLDEFRLTKPAFGTEDRRNTIEMISVDSPSTSRKSFSEVRRRSSQ